jgi:hypothetical protein
MRSPPSLKVDGSDERGASADVQSNRCQESKDFVPNCKKGQKMPKLRFSFARGGYFTARVMIEKAPKTWEAIRTNLPVTTKAYNARWTGRETHTKLDLPNKPPRENQILNAGLGDVIYAAEWSDRDVTGFEAIGWFYGTETVRDWRGESRVNLFARVDQSEWPFLEEVGLRTWREGGEDCTISILEE